MQSKKRHDGPCKDEDGLLPGQKHAKLSEAGLARETPKSVRKGKTSEYLSGNLRCEHDLPLESSKKLKRKAVCASDELSAGEECEVSLKKLKRKSNSVAADISAHESDKAERRASRRAAQSVHDTAVKSSKKVKRK